MASPYSLAAGDVVEARYIMTLQEQRLMMVLHYRKSLGSTVDLEGVTAVQSFAAAMGALVAGAPAKELKDATTEQVLFLRVEAQKVSALRWAKRIFPLGYQGGIVGTAAPSNLACDITRITDLPSRRAAIPFTGGVGTTHIGGFPLEAIDGNKVEAGYKEGPLTDLADALSVPITAGTNLFEPVLWHRRASDQPNSTKIVDAYPEEYVRTMRRRGGLLGI